MVCLKGLQKGRGYKMNLVLRSNALTDNTAHRRRDSDLVKSELEDGHKKGLPRQ